MRRNRPALFLAVSGLVVGTLVAVAPTAGAAPVKAATDWTATAVKPTSVAHGSKSASGRLAQSDPALLKATSTASVDIVVKLDYDAVAAYDGGVARYAATNPTKTGQAFSDKSAAVRRYTGYATQMESRFVSQLKAKVPAATVGRSLQTVYGGVAVRLPANQAAGLLSLPDVSAVQSDTLQKPLTDASSQFIGATSLYPALGGKANAGKGIIVGVLDTGLWPEHPSFAAEPGLGTPPAKADGTARVCNFGDNPLTPATDPFVCNNKLIGGQVFLQTYLAQPHPPETYPTSARDSDGHGTHTSSTAAGDPVASAKVLGVERGPINGIAPGAWVSMYKVCGASGCANSDSVAAVGQAIKDGVKVINFSISGGTAPYSDPVELAFLDAYSAGVLVATSAGNDGPTVATVNHLSPWVMSVAASTQTRAFESTLTVSSTDGAKLTAVGASITQGAGPAPVVSAAAAPYSDALCAHPAPAGTFTGKIVVCERGSNARVDKGYNVNLGNAAGMILYNPALADVETDNHWLPAVHLEDGTALVAFLAAHTGITAQFTAGAKAVGQGDVMAGFSSRGPGGDFLKPDVTAPGVQILAGNSPTPDSTDLGPSGQYYQAIAGTSMASPHVAGAAALLFALHPSWSPGQVKSALETTGVQTVLKEDKKTAADPFDMGSGRIDLTRAGDPGLTFSDTAADFTASATTPLTRIDLNIASINAPTMPGVITTTRTATNVSGKTLHYKASTTGPAGATIIVTPSSFTLAPGKSIKLKIYVGAVNLTEGQYFAGITLTEQDKASRNVHLPVAFFRKQGSVSLTQTCSPTTIAKITGKSTCTVTAQNNSPAAANVTVNSHLSGELKLASVTGATATGTNDVGKSGSLVAPLPADPQIASGTTPGDGYLPLDLFGIPVTPIGDEDLLNFTVPDYVYAGKTYSSIGVDSNGYVVAGGGTSQDNECCTLKAFPNPTRPNAVLAPFWTDLDGSHAPGILIGTLTDGVHHWIVVEWRVNVFGTTSQRNFQVWLGTDGTEDVSFGYDPTHPPTDPGGQPVVVGAENQDGSKGSGFPIGTLPTTDLRVTSIPGAPGGVLTYSYTLTGQYRGTRYVRTEMQTPAVRGTTSAVSLIVVK